MDTQYPLVSIIVRTKDRPKLLRRALQSIAAQTYRPIEVILVNDGGCDIDVGEMTTLLGKVSLNYIRLEKNTGRAHAGNVGIENAVGDHIGFLDDDDELYPSHIETLATFLGQSNYKVAYTDAKMVYRQYDTDTDGFTDEKEYVFSSRDFSLPEILLENYIPFITVMFHSQIFLSVGKLDEQFIAYEDWEFFIRCSSVYPFAHINKVTAKYIQWNKEQQIAQCREFWSILDKEYDKVINKHHNLFSPKTVRSLRDVFKNLSAEQATLAASIYECQQKISEMERRATDDALLVKRLDGRNTKLEATLKEKEEYLRSMESRLGWRVMTKYDNVRRRLVSMFRSLMVP